MRRTIQVILTTLALGLPLRIAAAQEPAAQPSGGEINIMEHLGNSHVLEVPYYKAPYHYDIELPRWQPVRVGPVALDFSPTKHLIFLLLAALIVSLVFLYVSRAVQRAHAAGRHPTGFAGAMEAIVLWVRQEVILPNVGHHGEGYVPYLLSVFFFILACNLLGLVPWGSTPTGNIAVTGGMALISFIVIEISGMRTLGTRGYLGTIFFVPHGVPALMKPILLVILTPIELVSKLAKPFALAVRLFANMTAGHVVLLALIGFTFMFQSYLVGGVASVGATLIMVLELFVAFLHAFIFTLLTAVFIGLIRAEH
ncbi:MAG TPA: F0F1 ATP synthase subunit A [Gemmatimonadales bacterium]